VYLVTSLIVPGELSWENRPQRYQLPVFSVTVCDISILLDWYRVWLTLNV
jgi:hypothetical protein